MITAKWIGLAVSDNRRLIPGKGRLVANRAYKKFKEGMAWELTIFETYGREERVSVILRVKLPAHMDVSAIIKAALDAIQLSGVIKDDNQIDRLEVLRCGTSNRGESEIAFEIDSL